MQSSYFARFAELLARLRRSGGAQVSSNFKRENRADHANVGILAEARFAQDRELLLPRLVAEITQLH
jgi:hypothetical protein